MNDLIRREDVLDCINDTNNQGGFTDYSAYSCLFDNVDHVLPSTSGWISVKDRLPEIEKNVLIVTKTAWSGSLRVNQAFYEDGKMSAEASDYSWDIDFIDMRYDEDEDDYIVPQGWFVYNDYLEEFCEIVDEVLYWQPLPEPPKAGDTDGR